jgi:CheY-like chemotaxis protein
MPRGGTIRLRVGNAAADEPGSAGLPQGAYVRFEVADEGEGMTPEVLERAVEPFFTTKEPGKGTGLGLPMVLGFARQSGGELRIASHPGRGTTVSLWLPRASAAAGDSPASRGDGPVQPPSGRIPVMLVDDEPLALRTLALILDKAGYQPEAMQDGQQALRRLQEGEVCAMLITDQSMPGLSGSDLIKQATRLRPGLPTILITGYDRLSGLDELEGRVTVLRKPIRRAEFLRQIEALLEPMVDGRQTQQGAGRSDAPANGNVVVFRTGPLR